MNTMSSVGHAISWRAKKLSRTITRPFEFLWIQRVKGFETPVTPHFDAPTLKRFADELGRANVYLEYGSGGSTIMADRLRKVTRTVESDRFYARAVRRGLGASSTVTIVVPDLGLTGYWGRPLFNRKAKGSRYVGAGYADPAAPMPDLVLVDGRYRVACALGVARRANRAGTHSTVLFDDYRERPEYHVIEEFLGEPERIGRSAIFRVGKQLIPDATFLRFAEDAA